jgi:two-component system alkaline phosphatase synthesis response regulator PhoP
MSMKDNNLLPFVIVADGDEGLVRGIVNRLIDSNFAASGAISLREVSRILADRHVNLLIINVSVGSHSGIEYVNDLRQNGINIPAIFIADRNARVSRVHALDVGDDIVQKPILSGELVARVRAVIRRASTLAEIHATENITINGEPFMFYGATVHPREFRIAFPCGASEFVGRKEIALMAAFLATAGAITSRKDIIHRVWGPHADVRSRSMDQYVAKIRQLFNKHGCPWISDLRTIHGVGYLCSSSCPVEHDEDGKNVGKQRNRLNWRKVTCHIGELHGSSS